MSSQRIDISLGDIMGYGDGDGDGDLFKDLQCNSPELPNHKLEVKLQLTLKLIASLLMSLNSDLDKDGMEVREDRNNPGKNAIVVIGTPPQKGYKAKDVLKVVKKHDKGAKILSEREIRC